MKESPEDRSARKEVVEAAPGEGKLTFEFAPLAKPPSALPPSWRQALTDPDPTAKLLDLVWKPLAKQYPKTIASMRRSLQRVGLLTTAKSSHSIVYFFKLDDGDFWLRRGYLPAKKLPKIASRLPKDFLALYEVHDGWMEAGGMMGHRRSSEWGPLGQGPASQNFLVTFDGHGPAILGFDLREKSAPCYTVWTQSEPQRVRNVSKEIDEWLAIQMEELVPRAKAPASKPKAAAKPKSKAKPRKKR